LVHPQYVRSDLVGQELKAECYFRHKLPLYNVTKKCTYKIVLPHLANQNHNVNTCELLWFWFFIVAIKRNNWKVQFRIFPSTICSPASAVPRKPCSGANIFGQQYFFLKESRPNVFY
jgi:hypothetical protein